MIKIILGESYDGEHDHVNPANFLLSILYYSYSQEKNLIMSHDCPLDL